MAEFTTEELFEFQNLIDKMQNLDSIKASDIPNISLYMDQVTTFMDEHLASSRRNEDDKILTKTMINNYAKNKLLPPPEKKKYTKDHMILLILIYYLKNVMCIQDIKQLLGPMTDEYFGGNGRISLTEIYDSLYSFFGKEQSNFSDSIIQYYQDAKQLFTDKGLSELERKKLCWFAFISSLAFDVYLKKIMIETMLDEDHD